MKKRILWKMFVLEIITLGIYRVYWFIKTRQEMMDNDKSIKILSPMLFVIPFILIVISFGFVVFGSIQSAAELPEACKDSSYSQVTTREGSYVTKTTRSECQITPQTLPMIVFIISLIVIWPIAIVWLWSYSKGVETTTNGKMHFALTLIILILVPDGIDILLVQDSFNKLETSQV